MVIKGEDNRSIVTNFNVDGLEAVVGIDVPLSIPRTNSEVITDAGTGSLISPYHVLTAGHVIFSTPQASQAKVRLGQNAAALSSRTRTPLSSGDFDASGTNFSYPVSGYNGGTGGNDLGLITLDEPIGESSQYIGLAAFIDPQDADNLQVTTAGFPGVVEVGKFATNEDGTLNIEDSISENAQFLITDENNAPSEFLGLLNGRKFYLTDAVKMFTATGAIDGVNSEGRLNFSATLDAEQGQSGSGYWAYLEDDSKPRLIGVYSGDRSTGVSILDSNIGALITTDAYDNIVATMQPLLNANNLTGNALPENAVIGSKKNDSIKGSYRRERILGNEGNDTISGGDADDRLEGGAGNDVLKGEKGNDRLQGNQGNDSLVGGEGNIDVAVFSEEYTTENYDYEENTDGLITIEHLNGGADGTDTLVGIEWGLFKSGAEDLGNQAFIPQGGEDEFGNQTFVAADSGTASQPRIIPLPLEDGVEKTESVEVMDTTANPDPFDNDPPTPPYVSLTAPVAMLDGDIDYTLNISPFKPDTQYNISYIVSTSPRTNGEKRQQVKDALIDLNNYFIDAEVAEGSVFSVVPFNDQASINSNLTAAEAAEIVQNLQTTGNFRNRYNDALFSGSKALGQSSLDNRNTTNIAYFIADGRSYTNFFTSEPDYTADARGLRNLANVQAFGLDVPIDENDAGTVTDGQINFVDSNDGVIINNLANLSSELQKSGLAGDVQEVNILVDGEVVDTIQPEQLTDTPLGLTYEGSIDNLDVSIGAENVISTEVVFTPESNFATTAVDYTVTAGEGKLTDSSGNPIDESGNDSGDSDPFEKIRNGGDGDDDITLGYVDKGASGGAGGDKIVGNNRDNILDGGAGNDTIFGHGGDDTITTGAGDDRVDGGEGIDTVLYGDITYGNGNNIIFSKAGNTVKYANEDSLTDVEFIQFDDVRVSTSTLEVTPVIEVSDISVVEGNAGNTNAQFTFELSSKAPVDVVFDYSTADVEAVAGSDYVAESGELIIPAGDTTATLDVDVIGDSSYYDLPIETFALNLSGLSGATFANNRTEYTVSAAIENDDKFGVNPAYIFRTNAGGDDYFDTDFQPWSATEGFTGAGTFTSQNAIEQTEDDPLYQSEHFGNNFSYQQAVANGSYDVTLKFAEVFFNQAGKRVFDVRAEDLVILDDFDIYSEAGGKNIAVDRTFTVDVNDGLLDLGFLSSVDNAKVSAIEVVPTASILGINAGGSDYIDTETNQWLKSEGFTGGNNFLSSNPITKTEDDVLYQSERFGQEFSYNLAVANGSYDVTLKFAEVFFNQAGKRVFDVKAEDQTVIDDFDIYSEAGGKNIATDRTFTVDVNDGSIDLDFNGSIDKAKVSAIKIEPTPPIEATRPTIRTNAGGNAYTDILNRSWLMSSGFVGAGTFTRANAIAQTEDDVLYQSEAFGNNFSYQQEVANGSYDVTLKFAEVFFNNPGQRVFDVTAEGQTVLDDFDIVESASGKNIAVDRTFNVNVTDGSIDLGFLSSVDKAKVSAIEIKPTLPQFRTNAGGGAYTDLGGQSWLESSGFVGAGTFTRANAIAQTEDDVLYQSEVNGSNFSYQQEVANGSYDVTLKFAEVFFNNAGQRVFDVNLEGQTVLDDFDIVESSGGKNIAVDRTFNVNVTDGSIDLGFLSSVDKAKVSAIEIKPNAPSFRTNAGGGAYTDISGQSWLESSGFVGAGTFTRANAIAQTEDDVLYQSEAVGNNFSYQQEVANGSYDVTLKFAEVFFNNAGQRVFDVIAEGQTVLDDFDIVESAGGKNIAVDRTFTVGVSDGTLDLDFIASIDNAKVSAIEIKPSLI